MKLNATVGIVLTLVIGIGLLGFLIISRQDEIRKGADIVEIADKLGMDTDQFIEDFESEEVAEIVENDRLEALDRLGGSASTPSMFVEGQYYDRQTNPDVIGALEAMVASTDEAELPLLVEVFEDYNCSACAGFQPVLYEIKQNFTESEIDLRKRHLPFLKDTSTRYAKAAEAARKQGRFEEYNIELYLLLHSTADYDFYPFSPVSI